VIFRTVEACPKFSLGTLWRFFNDFYFIFGLFMIALGGYLISVGNKYQDITLFLVGQASVSTLFMIVVFAGMFPDQQDMWVVWVILIISLAVGAAAGYATRKWGKYGVLILGAWLGGIIGSIMYSLLFRLLWEENGTEIMWLSITAFGVLLAYLSQVYFHFAVIAGSSIIGSFLFYRVRISQRVIFFHV
jgi:Domain of unknown function (DUF4203)